MPNTSAARITPPVATPAAIAAARPGESSASARKKSTISIASR